MLVTNPKSVSRIDAPAGLAGDEGHAAIQPPVPVGTIVIEQDVSPNDFLYKNTKLGNNDDTHPGNILIKTLLADNLEEYKALPTGTKQDFCSVVLDEITIRGGRFLEKLDGNWHVMDVYDSRLLRRCHTWLDAAMAKRQTSTTTDHPVIVSASAVQPNDVGGPKGQNRPGTLRFRELTSARAKDYENATNTTEKRAIMLEIYDAIVSAPFNGRFLLPSETKGSFIVAGRDDSRLNAIFTSRFQTIRGESWKKRKHASKVAILQIQSPKKERDTKKRKKRTDTIWS
jgi:hypothetical protein